MDAIVARSLDRRASTSPCDDVFARIINLVPVHQNVFHTIKTSSIRFSSILPFRREDFPNANVGTSDDGEQVRRDSTRDDERRPHDAVDKICLVSISSRFSFLAIATTHRRFGECEKGNSAAFNGQRTNEWMNARLPHHDARAVDFKTRATDGK